MVFHDGAIGAMSKIVGRGKREGNRSRIWLAAERTHGAEKSNALGGEKG